jgi:CheY-like chemotaxis protein
MADPLPGRIRILVVDDIADTAESFARLLARMGFETTFVTDPRLAVDTAYRFGADLVFLDIGMPELDGYEVARMLRGQFGWDKLRIVAVTAYGQQSDRDRSRQAGFDAHVVKPVGLDLVRSILGTMFPGHGPPAA